jgi:hypothetical protein
VGGTRSESRWRACPLAALLLALALAACAREGPRPAEPAGEPSFVDDQGRRYVVRSLAKRQAVRVDAGKARTRWGFDLELTGEDAEHWYFKYYLPAEAAPAKSEAPVPQPFEEAVAPVALPESRALRFERFDAGLPKQGQWRDGFDVADLDGDGQLDLVHGPPRKGARLPQVWLGDGRGRWRLWRDARFPALDYDYGDARAADLDGDGALDLVLAVHLRGLLALRGDGRGGFLRAGDGLDFAETAGAAGFSSRAARIVDLDGDGRLDVLALGEGPRLAGAPNAAGGSRVLGGAQGVVLYRGTGGGRFERRDLGTGAQEIFGGSLAVADFDADGRLDFATASGQLGRRDLVRLGRADGVWQPLPLAAVRAKAYVRAVAAADFDADGRADLALAYTTIASGSWWSGVDVLLARPGDPWQRVPLLAEEGTGGARALAAADLDADGAADLVALGASGSLAVLRGDGRGAFRREIGAPASFAGGCRGAHLALADLDGDGLADLLASFAEERGAGDPPACPSEGGLAAWRTLRDAPAP